MGRATGRADGIDKAESLRYKAASLADTAAVARVARRLGGTSPTLTALGPISGVESYDKVVGRLA